MTNGGFYRLNKNNITEDGKTMSDVVALMSSGNMADAIALSSAVQESKIVDITMGKMFNEEGQEVVIGTTPQARQWMIERCKNHGTTFTKGL
jgi:hypothetical protein